MWSCALKLKQLRKHYNTTGKKEKEKEKKRQKERVIKAMHVGFFLDELRPPMVGCGGGLVYDSPLIFRLPGKI